jgi:hypothetical protein
LLPAKKCYAGVDPIGIIPTIIRKKVVYPNGFTSDGYPIELESKEP